MTTLVTTTTYMTFREDSTTSTAITCDDLGCKNPGNDKCRHPGCVAVNSLLYGDQGYSGLHGMLGRRLSYEKKKRLSFSLCFISAFLTGTEYAIILPTVWKYLQQLGQTDERYIGYVTSAFSVGSVLSHLVVGRFADQTRDSRHIILIVNVFQIIGQLIYAIGVGGTTLIIARFLSGVGVGLNSALFAEVVRGTGRRERPWYIVGSFMTRQLSIFLAPVYNTAMRHLPVIQFPLRNGYTLKLHEGSYPGVVMAILWTCFEVGVALFFFNMTVERKAERYRRRQNRALSDIFHNSELDLEEDHEKEPEHKSCVKALALARSPSTAKLIPVEIMPDSRPIVSKLKPPRSPPHRKDGFLECERHPLLFDSGCHGSSNEVHSRSISDASDDYDDYDETVELRPVLPHRYQGDGMYGAFKDRQVPSLSRQQELALMSVESMGQVTGSIYRQEFLSRHAIPLLFMQFTVMTCQTMVETVIPPILQCYFKYGPKENSYMFMGIGAEELVVHGILLMFSGVVKPSNRVPPRTLLVASSVIMLVGLSGLMITSRSIEISSGGKSHNCPLISENDSYFVHFAQCCALLFLGIPIAAVMSVSLLSQLLDYRVQGMGQGLSRFCCSLGMIVGPLWGGCLVYRPELLYGGAIAVVAVELVLLAISFSSLKLPD